MLDVKQVVATTGPRRVLVVDDHHDTAEVLSVMLEMLGHEPRCAHRGHEAIATAREWDPDLVLLDIGLPDLSGHQVAQALRSDPTTARCDIIAVTCWDNPDDIARSMSAGCDAHVAKPLNLEKLRRLIGSVGRARGRARTRAPSSPCDVHASVA